MRCLLMNKNENGLKKKKKKKVKNLDGLYILPLLCAAIVGGVVQIDGHARQLHDVTNWSCVGLQPI